MNYQRIMVFGAHPDDEITMSGTIAKMSDLGVRVVVVTCTNGCEGYPREEWQDNIADMRRSEAAEADKVLGIARRIFLDVDDMALTPDKPTLHRCIRIIREERPEAIFTHGPFDRHRDHLATHILSTQAAWHAGEPVSRALGEPWVTRHLYYYKGVPDQRASVLYDVSGYQHKRYEALATQVSQHTLFGQTREELLAKAEEVRAAGGKAFERFWFTEWCELHDFPPAGL